MKIISIFEKDKAESNGLSAGRKGKPSTECPYQKAPAGKQNVENMCYRNWMSGWIRGKLEFKHKKLTDK